MGFDKIILKILNLIRKKNYQNLETSKKISKENAIKRKISKRTPSSKKTYLILSGWYENKNPSILFRKRILKSGDSYIFYELSKKILSSRTEQVKEYMAEIRKEVIRDLKKIKNEKILIGTSLGGIPTLMIAKKEIVDYLILLMPSDSLAKGVWKSIRTRKIRKDLIKQKISLKKLEKIWKELEPKNNLKNLENTKIIIFNSKSDLVIPYKRSQNLIKEMKKRNLKILVFTNKELGHYLTAIKIYMSKKIFKLVN
ncbi:MAG: hypothetical protein KC516_00220 [Nanoarchaeota archaeon]|nr:hypothetical protein [Nanoarchaeota archaeon]